MKRKQTKTYAQIGMSLQSKWYIAMSFALVALFIVIGAVTASDRELICLLFFGVALLFAAIGLLLIKSIYWDRVRVSADEIRCKKQRFGMREACVTVYGPLFGRVVYGENVFVKVYVGTQYLTQTQLSSIRSRCGCIEFLASATDLATLFSYYDKPVSVVYSKFHYRRTAEMNLVIKHNAEQTAKKLQSFYKQLGFAPEDFASCSGRATAAYAICCLESAMRQFGCNADGFLPALSALWTVTSVSPDDEMGRRNLAAWCEVVYQFGAEWDNVRFVPVMSQGTVADFVTRQQFDEFTSAVEGFPEVVADMLAVVAELVALVGCDSVDNFAATDELTVSCMTMLLDPEHFAQFPAPDIRQFDCRKALRGEDGTLLDAPFDGTQFSLFVRE